VRGSCLGAHEDGVVLRVGATSSAWKSSRMTNMVVDCRLGQLSVVTVYMVGEEERVSSWLGRSDVEPDAGYVATPQVGWEGP
jgi:hypothetical protein